jgi:hypothetical protein
VNVIENFLNKLKEDDWRTKSTTWNAYRRTWRHLDLLDLCW